MQLIPAIFFMFSSVVFFIYMIFTVLGNDYAEVSDMILIPSSLAVYCIIFFLFKWNEERQSDKLLTWIFTNADTIETGTAFYKNEPVHKKTRLVQHKICISFLLFTAKIDTRLTISGSISSTLTNIFCTLFTLGFGWWGIPWGPVYTFTSIRHNLDRSSYNLVGDLIQ